tara:strand:+ start:174 stop:458 length:285 start_codon:yes stop_codon:yes gene_type:complete
LVDHLKILVEAEKQARRPEDVPRIETLHQNVAHLTVALKELETRLIRVTNKVRRHKIADSDPLTVPLAKAISSIRNQLDATLVAVGEEGYDGGA